MKKLLSLVSAFLIIVSLCVSVSAQDVTIYDTEIDKTTGGSWVGVYGADGYIMFGPEGENIESLPDYASIEVTNLVGDPATGHSWFDSEKDDPDLILESQLAASLLKGPDTTERRCGCMYDGTGLSVSIDVGSEPKIVNLYMADFDENGRVMEFIAYDESGNELKTFEVSEFFGGAYLKAEFSGKVTFEMYNIATDMVTNAVIGGIFFDSPASAAPAETEAAAVEETVAAQESAANEEVTEAAETVAETAAPAEAEAPQTSDTSAAVAVSAVIAAGIGIAVIMKKRSL